MSESVEQLSKSDPPVRLSISHLMLFTLGTAATLASYLAIPFPEIGPRDYDLKILRIYSYVSCVAIGPAVATVLLVPLSRFGFGPKLPANPGHWLLLIHGVAVVAWQLIRHTPISSHWKSAHSDIVFPLLVAGLFSLGTLFVRNGWHWRMCLINSFVMHLLCAGASMYERMREPVWPFAPIKFFNPPTLQTTFGILAAVLVVCALALDKWRQESRDYLHWLGALTHVFLATVSPLILWQHHHLARWWGRWVE